jgi:DNA-binding response OmpR family regulator
MDKIVIQETDRAVLDVLKLALTEAGFEVYATDQLSVDFLDIIAEKQSDVVVLDYKLDGQDAINVCNQIKQRFPHLPIIALSCNYNIDQEYGQHGFDDFIRKPFDIDRLVKIIRKHIPAMPKSVNT